MPLHEALIGCRIIETTHNYARADAPLLRRSPPEVPERREGSLHYDDDQQLWHHLFGNQEQAEGQRFYLYAVVFSEWVARVPGLYWRPESERLRHLNPEAVEYRSQYWVTYTPGGKSRKVMGGIGTLRLPANTAGYRLGTLTTTLNVSAGIPVLVSPDVWDHLRLAEGVVLEGGQGRWQAMSDGWSAYFPSTRDIPRGYLILDDPDAAPSSYVPEAGSRPPVLIHPFTMMEYEQGQSELFDYVYAEADTWESGYRRRLERFFDSYKDRHNRFGEYLLAGDLIKPLWSATYDSPQSLRRAEPGSESALNLLNARVAENMLGGQNIELLLEALIAVSDTTEDVRMLADEAGIPSSRWYTGGSVAEVSNRLLDAALRRDQVMSLVEIVALHYPERFALNGS